MFYVDLRLHLRPVTMIKRFERFLNISANNIVSRNYSIKETIQQMQYFRFFISQ